MAPFKSNNDKSRAIALITGGIILHATGGLCLSAVLFCAPALADEALKGNVEETGLAPPEVPMAVPVFKPKKLKGTADDSGNGLKGGAQDDGGDNLKGMNAQTDDSGPLKGNAQDDNPNTLKANLSQDQLQSEDPDRDDQQMAVEWDKWRNNLLHSVQSGVMEIVNSKENMVPHFDQARNRLVYAPNIPLGTKATFWVKVNRQRRILDARILASSGNAGYDKALLDAIYSLDGSNILRYPTGSKRVIVDQAATILTSDRGGYQNFKFGDVEHYSTP